MPYLIGMDEAGYGPNLGPLVISATVWRVPEELARCDLYQRLRSAISPKAAGRRLAIADSKALYHPGGGIHLLERGVLAALAVSGREVCDWHSLWSALEADPLSDRAAEPWLAEYNRSLPGEVASADLEKTTAKLQRSLQSAGIELVAVRSRAVLPARFNRLVHECGNKAQALSLTSLGLLAEVLAPLSPEPVFVVCDKHGGRNQYQPLLQSVFPEYLVEVNGEGRAESRYCWGPQSARVEVRFCVGGETFLPAALASMACKYLRELSMQAFNDFWCTRVPGLAPTAGYPLDAKRFKAEISALQQELRITDDLLWRVK